jgi:DNA-binding transcriptional MerR regulator
MGEIEQRRWKVGELARATGLTIWALHHLDDLGLLVPSERTQAGHRLYDQEDVRRLYRIVALRRLICREEVARVLGDERIGQADTVGRDLERVGHRK